MGFSVNSIKKELDTVVSTADSYADLVDKYADAAGKLAGDLPGSLGGDAEKAIALLDEATRALNALQAFLSAA